MYCLSHTNTGLFLEALFQFYKRSNTYLNKFPCTTYSCETTRTSYKTDGFYGPKRSAKKISPFSTRVLSLWCKKFAKLLKNQNVCCSGSYREKKQTAYTIITVSMTKLSTTSRHRSNRKGGDSEKHTNNTRHYFNITLFIIQYILHDIYAAVI